MACVSRLRLCSALVYTSHFFCLTYLSPCFFLDVLSERSDGEGGGGAETETAEVRAEPPGQPDQRAGPPQENGGELPLAEYPLDIMMNLHLTSKSADIAFISLFS